ncbi:Cytochrome C biogenesis protein transmembrane region [compost metagenome]
MGKVFGMPLWGFFAGLLNGLIPCGMVYLALATALNTATIRDGGMFMFLFGLGTVPLMLLISLGGIYLKKYIRFNSRKLVPWFMLFMGLLFAFRAANLGIPFLSPDHSMHAHAAGAICR